MSSCQSFCFCDRCMDLATVPLPVQVPLIPELPEYKAGWVLQDGNPVQPNLYGVLKEMVGQMNLVIKDLPDLSQTQT